MGQRGSEARRMGSPRQCTAQVDAQTLLLDATQAIANQFDAARVAQPFETCGKLPTGGRDEDDKLVLTLRRLDDGRRIIGWRDCRLSRFSVGSGGRSYAHRSNEEVLVTMAPRTLLTVVATLLLLLAVTPAHAFRCGTRIITRGDHADKILRFCGEPASVQTRLSQRSYVSHWGRAYPDAHRRGRDRRVDLQLGSAPARTGREARERLRSRYHTPRLRLLAATSAAARSSGTCSIS